MIVFRSVNEAICHGIPDQRKLQEGDIINIGTSSAIFISPRELIDAVVDISLYYDGLCLKAMLSSAPTKFTFRYAR